MGRTRLGGGGLGRELGSSIMYSVPLGSSVYRLLITNTVAGGGGARMSHRFCQEELLLRLKGE